MKRFSDIGEMQESPDGAWIEYDEVKPLLDALDAYLQRPSMDGKADRQTMRAELRRMLNQLRTEDSP